MDRWPHLSLTVRSFSQTSTFSRSFVPFLSRFYKETFSLLISRSPPLLPYSSQTLPLPQSWAARCYWCFFTSGPSSIFVWVVSSS